MNRTRMLLVWGAAVILFALSSVFASGSATTCYWDSWRFGVDCWITSAPEDTVLATFAYGGKTYPAFVALEHGSGRVAYAAGSTFSQLYNLVDPGYVRNQLFLNAVAWVTRDKSPAQARALVTYGHRELVTYHQGGQCCSSNAVQSLAEEGYAVDVAFDIPPSLGGYDVVVMPGVGWHATPGYPNPLYWSGNSGHAPTRAEIATLLAFVQDGGGLVSSVEWSRGAAWMSPIGNPMGVTFAAVSSATPLWGERIVEHPIFEKPCPVTLVHVDVKPQSCPNPVNRRGGGVLPVAVLGTPNLDVSTIDPTSIRLQGVPALRYSYEDVATPVWDRQGVCDCTTAGPDGFIDLPLKFDKREILSTIPDPPPGDEIVLTLTGSLLDGTPIEGQDCILLLQVEDDIALR